MTWAVMCECSGTVRDALLARGVDAVSIDLKPTRKPGPHIQGNALDYIGKRWAGVIAHPVCKRLTNAGAKHLYIGGRKENGIDVGMWLAMEDGARFFNAFKFANAPKIARALASAVAEPVDEVAPVTVPADSTLVVVSCEVDYLDAATFFDYLGTGAGPQRRANAMQTYARMPVVARAQVVAGLRERLEAGVTDLQVRAWMVAFIAAHEAAIVVWSPDHGVSFHIEATIGLAGDKVTVHASENYVLRGAAAKEFASKALAAVSAALADAGIDGRTQVTRRGDKRYTWQPTGYWHMDQFCCNGRSASIRVAGVKA